MGQVTYDGPVTVLAAVTDDVNPGIFIVTVTLTIAGEYSLQIHLNDLEVPTDISVVTVTPSSTVSHLYTTYTGLQDIY